MIYEVKLRDWTELLDCSYRLPMWVFRGQPDYALPLTTTLERLGKHFWSTTCPLANREFWILTQFRRRAHNLIEKPPDYDDWIAWLALIQHYGGPTRLLDFTRSLFLGLFFACEGTDQDSAMWMIDTQPLLNRHAPRGPKETMWHQHSLVLKKARQYIGVETTDSGVLPVEAERLDVRMSIQKGVSLMPISIQQPFMDNLVTEFSWPGITYREVDLKFFLEARHGRERAVAAKVRLKTAWHPDILRRLDDMNINSNTLFPGLDGFARSLRIHLLPSGRGQPLH